MDRICDSTGPCGHTVSCCLQVLEHMQYVRCIVRHSNSFIYASVEHRGQARAFSENPRYANGLEYTRFSIIPEEQLGCWFTIYIYIIYIYLHTDCHCTRLTIDYMYITYYRFQDVIASIYLGCIMHHPISHLPANPGAGARSFAGVSISQLESETPSSRASESWKRKCASESWSDSGNATGPNFGMSQAFLGLTPGRSCRLLVQMMIKKVMPIR